MHDKICMHDNVKEKNEWQRRRMYTPQS